MVRPDQFKWKALTKYAKQRSECYIWIRETLGRIHAGLSFDGIQMTLESYVETWLKGKELSRRPKTVEQYAQLTGDTSCHYSDNPPDSHTTGTPATTICPQAGGRTR